ncbi:MAG: DUF2505 domain-containing protein [Pseudomonadota bacterium]
MKKSLQHHFAYPLADVVNLFLDADILCQMMVDLGNRDVSVTVEPKDDDRVDIAIIRTVSADPPALIRAITGDWVEVHQQERWTGLAGAGEPDAAISVRMMMDPIGKPARGSGTLRFTEDAAGETRCAATVEVTCSVPLAATLVERMIVSDSIELLSQQFGYVDRLLAERSSAARTG